MRACGAPPPLPPLQVGWVTSDATLVASRAAPLTYVDSNFTANWIYVMPPARLTIENMVLTRLWAHDWYPGHGEGSLAGSIPLFLLRVASPPNANQQVSSPSRSVTNSTLVVPQYEVHEMQYWCIMPSLAAPELVAVADFLRSVAGPGGCAAWQALVAVAPARAASCCIRAALATAVRGPMLMRKLRGAPLAS